MHQKASAFDRLVTGLSANERLDMLKRIQTQPSENKEPLFESEASEESESVEAIFSRLGLIQRIVLFLKALFKQKEVMAVLEETVFEGFAREIETAYPGLYTYRTNTLGASFARELRGLREAIDIFSRPLAKAFGTLRGEFLAFLVGIEFPDYQSRLISATNPENYIDPDKSKTDFDIRRLMESDVQVVFKEMSDSDRTIVYRHVRSLHYLNEFVSFPVSKLLGAFSNTGLGETAPVGQTKNELFELSNLMASQGQPIEENPLKALFMFDLQEKLEDQNSEKVEQLLAASLENAYQGLSQIRSFNRSVPLKKLIRVGTHNMSYGPEQVGGGEDWFVLYRKFWEERLESCMDEFSFTNGKIKLLREVNTLFSFHQLEPAENYQSDLFEEDIRVHLENTIAFIKTFVNRLFLGDMNRTIQAFMVDGEFYKPQNREEFVDSYEGIHRSLNDISRMDSELAPQGSIGREIQDIRNELSKPALRRRKIETVLKNVDTKAEEIVKAARASINLFVRILKGILYGQSGGKYDTLSNISYIGGTDNARLIGRLSNILKQIEEAERILNGFYDLEKSVQ
ncbi:MAG: hypothetical protein CMN78_04155 [Spirochaetales bacterium]|nr:hypothetical protein [Spirochaetales bacterium]